MNLNSTFRRDSDELQFTGLLNPRDLEVMGENVRTAAVRICSEKLAEEFMAKHGQDIIAKIPLESVLNQAVAKAVSGIAGSIDKNEEARSKR